MNLTPHLSYMIDLPVAIVLVSLVYSATRYEDWLSILRETGWWILRLFGFLGGIAAVLFLLSVLSKA